MMTTTNIKKPQTGSRLLLRRKLAVIAIILVTFIFLLLFNLGSYLFLNRMGGFLEAGLDARLDATAAAALDILETEINDLQNVTEQSLLRLRLERLRNRYDLEAVYIIDTDLQVIIDSRPELETISRGYLREDSAAFRQVDEGEIVTSVLHTVAGNHFKNVYAQLFDFYGNSAILVLEASAGYFNAITFFRKGLYLGTLASIILLGLLVFFLSWATKLLIKTDVELQQSQRLAAMGQMAATVAHEIRNPLGIIKSAGDVLREKYQKPEQPDEMWDFINEETGRLNRLVNNFLSFSREPQLHLAVHDLQQLVQEAINSFNAEKLGETHVVFKPAAKELPVNCDRDMLHRVLMNLLINARQAVTGGNAAITITIGRENSKGKSFAVVEISDNGTGISGNPEEIFNPFFTTKTQGTGLGLAVSRNIIEKHGGKISAANNNGPGATIRFTVPAK
ncbi:MAG TPA: ATP-binding protein [bacterium]|nr:ATP-binding protein [bacterium]